MLHLTDLTSRSFLVGRSVRIFFSYELDHSFPPITWIVPSIFVSINKPTCQVWRHSTL